MLALFTLAFLSLGRVVPANVDDDWILHPRSLRAAAIKAPLPDFPLESFYAGVAGVAVAEVYVGQADGRVSWVRILQAPDNRISERLSTILHLWRFDFQRVLPNEAGKMLRSRLIFYFSVKDNRPIVIDAVADDLRTHPIPRQRKIKENR
jgi:hypothetical protein